MLRSPQSSLLLPAILYIVIANEVKQSQPLIHEIAAGFTPAVTKTFYG